MKERNKNMENKEINITNEDSKKEEPHYIDFYKLYGEEWCKEFMRRFL
jgi:hypothetical protein